MRIGVISDSHYEKGNPLPPLQDFFQDVDFIVHAGDVGDPAFLEILKKIAPTYYVAGNCDYHREAFTWPRQQVICHAGCKIGLIHGDDPRYSPQESAYRTFQNKEVQAVVFGHSHKPYQERKADGIFLFNPGSVSRPLGNIPQKSYGILTLSEQGITGEIIYLP